MKKKLSFLLSVIIVVNFYAQDRNHKIVNYFKNRNLDSVEVNINKSSNLYVNEIFKQQLDYLITGKVEKFEVNKNLSNFNSVDSILYYQHLADFYTNKINPNDTLTFKYNKIALKIAKNNNDTLLINESLIRINRLFLKNSTDLKLNKQYVNELLKYKQDRIDDFWCQYYYAMYQLSFPLNNKDSIRKIKKEFVKLEKVTPERTDFQSISNHSIGIFYHSINKPKIARQYFIKALIINESKYYSYSRKVRTIIGLSVMDFKEKKYHKSIKQLKETLKSKFVKTDYELKYLIYDWIYKSYNKLNIKDSSQHYLELKIKSKDSVKYYHFAEKIRDIDVKYKVKETKQQLKNSQSKNKKLNSKMNTILPILAIITLLLGVVFILFKKYYKKTEHLEIEKFETIKKIDELKQIVVKNHIVLKDKTKVYIADLLYIKADDHYLKIYLSNGKDHFVRGKLNKIIEELPPNFIRSHRSFVVNRNFVKQINNANIVLVDKTEIPLSRTYKERF